MKDEYAVVVTRYGGHKHLGRGCYSGNSLHFTLCRGTSSWTVDEWKRTDDHPLLTIEQIEALPPCLVCRGEAGIENDPSVQTATLVVAEGWTWDVCIVCGAADVVERRWVLLHDGRLGRAAWCSRPTCGRDMRRTGGRLVAAEAITVRGNGGS